MKKAIVSLIVLLVIMLVTGSACGEDTTKAVNSCNEAYSAQSEYFNEVADGTLAGAALTLYRSSLSGLLGTTQCSAFAEDYETNNRPLEEGELDNAYCYIIEDKCPLASLLSLGMDPRGEQLLDIEAGFADFEWMVLAEDGMVIPFNRNAMIIMVILMR